MAVITVVSAHSKVNICDILVDNLSPQESLDAIEYFIARRKPSYITNLNVDVAVRCQRDPAFRRYYWEGDLCLADGVPILWAAQFLGSPLKAKISGSDFVPLVCEMAGKRGYRVFFLGGRPGAASAAKKKLLEKFPDLNIVGTYSPPFGFEKDEVELTKISRIIQAANPEILFVGLGAPKQERWIRQYSRQLGVPVSMGVGVTFEFIAGIVKRAPRWMQKTGLEWFWRLLMEPTRLWKRYLIEDPYFFKMVLQQKIRRGK